MQDSAVTQALFKQLFEWVGQGGTQGEVAALLDSQAGNANGAGLVHLQLMMALQSRQLGRLQALSPARYNDELSRWRTGDLLTAWKNARRLKAKTG